MPACHHCETRFDGASRGFRRALWAVIAINATMFVTEMVAGIAASSMALKADALDFLGDTILLRYRDGDANVRSVWLCSRNDAIGNIAVVLAASGVFATSSAWPDLTVAALMAGLFLWSSVQIIRQAARELASTRRTDENASRVRTAGEESREAVPAPTQP